MREEVLIVWRTRSSRGRSSLGHFIGAFSVTNLDLSASSSTMSYADILVAE
jgi:hypothetical protein